MPTSAMPQYFDARLRYALMPERPIAPTTGWLHSVPPHAVPGTARPSFWRGENGAGVLLEWAARRLVTVAYAQGAHPVHCVTSGVEGAPALPKAEVIDKGGFGKAPHDDGIGEWSYADVFWSIDGKGRPSVFRPHIVPGSGCKLH